MRYRDFDKGGESIFIMCGLLKNGKVKVKISGHLPIYTSYSSVQQEVEEGIVELSTTKMISSSGITVIR